MICEFKAWMPLFWHSNEKRKIYCAKKYFEAIGVDYRPVNDKDSKWYKTWDEWKKMNPGFFEY